MKRALPWITGLAAIVLLVAINVGYRTLLDGIRTELDDQLGDRLVLLAETLAEQIDPVTLRLAVQEEFAPTAYLAIDEQVGGYRQANGLVDVALLDSGGVDLLRDESIEDSLTARIIGHLDRAALRLAIAGVATSSATYSWKENLYKSAYAPVVDTGSGSILALVRIEADAATFPATSAVERWLSLASVGTAVFALLLAGLFVWYVRQRRRWELRLLRTEKLVGLGRLAAVVAHEIRNPLGIIKATAQRLSRVEQAKQQELLDFIPQEVDRLDEILTGYLRMADPKRHRPTRIVLGEHLERWVRHAESGRGDGRVPTVVDVEDAPAITADSGGLRQVILNLLLNAFDATSPEEAVTVTLRTGRGGALIEIADRGPGIPRSERQKIFEPFYTTKAQGSGLGLYAVAALIEQSGGRISVGDRGDGCSGAVFSIWFSSTA